MCFFYKQPVCCFRCSCYAAKINLQSKVIHHREHRAQINCCQGYFIVCTDVKTLQIHYICVLLIQQQIEKRQMTSSE